ncbi:MAG: 5'/3'-nucleotidase SurE [Planctomycetaceae bacterium]
MRVVLTNDDGIEAPGLAAVEAAAAGLGGELVVVAPAECHSGCGHRVTTGRAIRVDDVGPARFRVAGTPADCVRIALSRLVPDAALVISGINAGGNLGADLHHSGTVAAAREAALHGVPAVAASQYHRRGTTIDWGRAARWLAEVLAAIRGDTPLRGGFWNVNLPDLPASAADPEVVECGVDGSPFGIDYRLTDEGWAYASSYHERPRVPGGDVDVCFGGRIAVSRVRAGS